MSAMDRKARRPRRKDSRHDPLEKQIQDTDASVVRPTMRSKNRGADRWDAEDDDGADGLVVCELYDNRIFLGCLTVSIL